MLSDLQLNGSSLEMLKTLGNQLYACGRKGPPDEILVEGCKYRLSHVFKHDFFAATARYEAASQSKTTAAPAKIILKLNRQHSFFGLPMLWLGRLISRHELSILRRLSHLSQVPHVLSEYDRAGFIYGYIEGCPLSNYPDLPKDFFDKLNALLRKVHDCNIIYLDTDKRSNILIGADNEPYLIDFQISLHIDDRKLIWKSPSKYVRDTLQESDFYHLFKHKRRLRPDLLTPQEKTLSRNKSSLIQLHRMTATPLRRLRRTFLKFLREKGVLRTQ